MNLSNANSFLAASRNFARSEARRGRLAISYRARETGFMRERNRRGRTPLKPSNPHHTLDIVLIVLGTVLVAVASLAALVVYF